MDDGNDMEEGIDNLSWVGVNVLSEELLLFIFEHLGAVDLSRVCGVNRRWYCLACDDSLWKTQARLRGWTLPSTLLISSNSIEQLHEKKEVDLMTFKEPIIIIDEDEKKKEKNQDSELKTSSKGNTTFTLWRKQSNPFLNKNKNKNKKKKKEEEKKKKKKKKKKGKEKINENENNQTKFRMSLFKRSLENVYEGQWKKWFIFNLLGRVMTAEPEMDWKIESDNENDNENESEDERAALELSRSNSKGIDDQLWKKEQEEKDFTFNDENDNEKLNYEKDDEEEDDDDDEEENLLEFHKNHNPPEEQKQKQDQDQERKTERKQIKQDLLLLQKRKELIFWNNEDALCFFQVLKIE